MADQVSWSDVLSALTANPSVRFDKGPDATDEEVHAFIGGHSVPTVKLALQQAGVDDETREVILETKGQPFDAATWQDNIKTRFAPSARDALPPGMAAAAPVPAADSPNPEDIAETLGWVRPTAENVESATGREGADLSILWKDGSGRIFQIDKLFSGETGFFLSIDQQVRALGADNQVTQEEFQRTAIEPLAEAYPQITSFKLLFHEPKYSGQDHIIWERRDGDRVEVTKVDSKGSDSKKKLRRIVEFLDRFGVEVSDDSSLFIIEGSLRSDPQKEFTVTMEGGVLTFDLYPEVEPITPDELINVYRSPAAGEELHEEIRAVQRVVVTYGVTEPESKRFHFVLKITDEGLVVETPPTEGVWEEPAAPAVPVVPDQLPTVDEIAATLGWEKASPEDVQHATGRGDFRDVVFWKDREGRVFSIEGIRKEGGQHFLRFNQYLPAINDETRISQEDFQLNVDRLGVAYPFVENFGLVFFVVGQSGQDSISWKRRDSGAIEVDRLNLTASRRRSMFEQLGRFTSHLGMEPDPDATPEIIWFVLKSDPTKVFAITVGDDGKMILKQQEGKPATPDEFVSAFQHIPADWAGFKRLQTIEHVVVIYVPEGSGDPKQFYFKLELTNSSLTVEVEPSEWDDDAAEANRVSEALLTSTKSMQRKVDPGAAAARDAPSAAAPAAGLEAGLESLAAVLGGDAATVGGDAALMQEAMLAGRDVGTSIVFLKQQRDHIALDLIALALTELNILSGRTVSPQGDESKTLGEVIRLDPLREFLMAGKPLEERKQEIVRDVLDELESHVPSTVNPREFGRVRRGFEVLQDLYQPVPPENIREMAPLIGTAHVAPDVVIVRGAPLYTFEINQSRPAQVIFSPIQVGDKPTQAIVVDFQNTVIAQEVVEVLKSYAGRSAGAVDLDDLLESDVLSMVVDDLRVALTEIDDARRATVILSAAERINGVIGREDAELVAERDRLDEQVGAVEELAVQSYSLMGRLVEALEVARAAQAGASSPQRRSREEVSDAVPSERAPAGGALEPDQPEVADGEDDGNGGHKPGPATFLPFADDQDPTKRWLTALGENVLVRQSLVASDSSLVGDGRSNVVSHQVTRKPSRVPVQPLTHILSRLIQAGRSDLSDELREMELTAEQRAQLARARNGIALIAVAEEIISSSPNRPQDSKPSRHTTKAAARAAETAKTTNIVRLPVR